MHRRLEGLKERLGSNGPGITIAVIALVLALAGGAFAASGALTGKQKKEVEKIAKKVAKPGPAGPAGSKGDKGDTGAPGAKGDKGEKGDPGTSVTASNDPTACGGRGGSKFVTGSVTTVACNGEQGEPGEPGEPWPVGGTLPPEATETGVWTFTGTTADASGIRVPLNFPIKLAAPLEGHVHYSTEFPAFSEKCHGNAEFPKADPGELCVYASTSEFPEETTFEGIFNPTFPENGASVAGAIIKFSAPTGNASGSGTFAVTAPAAP